MRKRGQERTCEQDDIENICTSKQQGKGHGHMRSVNKRSTSTSEGEVGQQAQRDRVRRWARLGNSSMLACGDGGNQQKRKKQYINDRDSESSDMVA